MFFSCVAQILVTLLQRNFLRSNKQNAIQILSKFHVSNFFRISSYIMFLTPAEFSASSFYIEHV